MWSVPNSFNAAVLIALALPIGAASQAEAKELVKPKFHLLDHRPANFYRSVSQKDKSICQPILDSLNKEHQITDTERESKNANTYLLLTSDLQVTWHHKRIVALPGTRPDKTDTQYDDLYYAKVNLADDGESVMVFRWAFYSFGQLMNELILPPATPKEITDDNTLPIDIIHKLSGMNAENVLDIDKSMPLEVRRLNDFPSSTLFDLNVVAVRKQTFLVAAGAEEGQRAVSHGEKFGVFIIKYHSKHDLSLICHFRGGYFQK